jgi:hypothetical protein
MSKDYIRILLSQTPIRVSILSRCNATDVSVLEKLGYLYLSDVERSRYLNPVRDLPCCNWVLDRIDAGDRAILIGSDIKLLQARISDPISYSQHNIWERPILLWVSIVSSEAVYEQKHKGEDGKVLVVDDATLRKYRVTPLEFQKYTSSDEYRTAVARVFEPGYALHRRMIQDITSFVPSEYGLSMWNDERVGWFEHPTATNSCKTDVSVVEYHEILSNDEICEGPNARCVAEIGKDEKSQYDLLSYCSERLLDGSTVSNVHTFYTDLNIDPTSVSISSGTTDSEPFKEGICIMIDLPFSPQSRTGRNRRIYVDIK